MRYGLIGEHLGHSFSQEIHRQLGGYDYELIELRPEQLAAFLKSRDFSGVNVTIPYKETVMTALDDASPQARAIGAVNAIINRSGALFGLNTDFGGLEALVHRMGIDMAGKVVLVAGSGGTAKTARVVAQSLGASRVVLLSRSEKPGCITYEQAYARFRQADILINATPAGMYPDLNGIPVDLERLTSLEAVVDVVYNPRETRLVREARSRGIRAEGGLYMLVVQAALSVQAFTGKAVSDENIQAVFEHLLEA